MAVQGARPGKLPRDRGTRRKRMRLTRPTGIGFRATRRAIAIVALGGAIPFAIGCGEGSDPISDQINQQVDGLRDQATQEALNQLNESSGGQLDRLQKQTERALKELDRANDASGGQLDELQTQTEQALEQLDEARGQSNPPSN